MTITIRIRLFSFYKDVLGTEFVEEQLNEENPTVGNLLDKLQEKAPRLARYRGTPLLNIMVNGKPAGEKHVLRNGDEIALLPIPSGG